MTASGQVPTDEVADYDVGWKSAHARSRTPTASFGFRFDPDEGVVTITHDGGDSLSASKLHVEGEGFADREGADQTSAGKWQGSTTDDGQVTAGHQVVVGVTSDYAIGLRYHGDRTVTLARDEGPDA